MDGMLIKLHKCYVQESIRLLSFRPAIKVNGITPDGYALEFYHEPEYGMPVYDLKNYVRCEDLKGNKIILPTLSTNLLEKLQIRLMFEKGGNGNIFKAQLKFDSDPKFKK